MDEMNGAAAVAEKAYAVPKGVDRVDVRGLESDLKRRVDGEVRFDTQSRALYCTDGSNYRQIPIGVVIPRNKDAVIETVAVCREYNAPILSRGCGTSLAGQCCNVAVVIDHSKYRNRILDIDPDAKTATIEPGAILDHLRNRAQEEHTLTFGPDPATHNHCTLGGMMGNDSCGIHSVMAGRTADNVEEMDIVTYDGVRMRVGPTGEDELDRIIAAGGRRGEIYKTMKEIRDGCADQIRQRYPNIPRRVSGYNLDDLLPENNFNVAKALVGTESTCVTILDAKVRLVHSPPKRSLLVLGYPDVYSAADHVMQIMEYGPVGLEGIDDKLVHFMKLKGLHPQDVQLLPDGGGWLLVEFGGDTKKESDDRVRDCMERLKGQDNAPSMKLFTDMKEEQLVWEIRESGLGATADVPTLPLAWPGWEDAAIHPEKEGDYLREFRSLLEKYNYIAALYGHFGQGCIHCRISFDLFTHDGIQKYLSFIDEASDLVLKYGGSFSGEHGDGQSKAIFLPKMYGDEIMGAFHRFKEAWDPDWRMNPGKIIDPYRPDQNLRLGEHYKPWQPLTHFRFPKDEGSFSRATLRCVGVGKCRKTEDTFMCPSFLVTHEEKDTTRGRAHLLFEMFHGGAIDSGWDSKEVLDSLDLCLACKGCKKECPVNVDIATYKAEFMSHYYQHRLRPRHAYMMGLIGFWGLLGARVPRLANFFSQTPGLSTVAKAVGGVAQQRRLPKFAAQTFRQWHAQNRDRRPATGQQVVLYTDPFNDYFYPHTLQAAYKILKHWGYDVVIPPGRVTSPRPLIHYGWLDLAESEIRTTLRQLSRFVEAGVPVVFCEPSTASVFRDDVPSLLPTDRDGQRLTKLAYLLSEFIEEKDIQVPKLGGKAIFHGHCHQKAVLNPDAARNVLKKMGLDFEEPQQTCCGMAGSFGFEAPHYGVSMEIAELGLFPAIRRATERTPIVADGFSCRTQIEEGTGRHALHMAELILMAFERNGELATHAK
jgi:FAD/FMN-containing dehydrogenase/Fe-S oxidoreductase